MPPALRFRLRAFGFHLSGSATALALILGALYLGWYRWPGWYLTKALGVAPILAGVDVALGPLVTLLIANPRKPLRELARDVGIIVMVQLVALVYGVSTLWQGRPLYYAFSEDRLQIVQASDLNSREIALAREQVPEFAPHWYSLPRWVWAPLPAQPELRAQIVKSAQAGGDDVIQMPRYFHSWESGLPQLRTQLLPVEQQVDIRLRKLKPLLRARLVQLGFDPEQANTLLFTGRSTPVLAVFDRTTLRLLAIVCAEKSASCLPAGS